LSPRSRCLPEQGDGRRLCACLDVALAFGYVEHVEPELLGKLDRVRAILAKVVM
jgi:hypothetical protein